MGIQKERQSRKRKAWVGHWTPVVLIAVGMGMLVVAVALVLPGPVPPARLGLSFEPTTEAFVELDPSANPTPVTSSQALGTFSSDPRILALWRPAGTGAPDEDPQDPPADTPSTKLVKDNLRTYLKWEVSNSSVTIWIDANTGEITHFSNYNFGAGGLTSDQATSAAQRFASDFSPIPRDVIHESMIRTTLFTKVLVDDNNQSTEVSYEAYVVRFARFFSGIASDDGIVVLVSTAGELVMYDKVLTLTLQGDLTPVLSQQEAESTARQTFHGTVTNAYLYVKRPNYYWTPDAPRYGYTGGILAWVVEIVSTTHDGAVWVHADTGQVIGGSQRSL